MLWSFISNTDQRDQTLRVGYHTQFQTANDNLPLQIFKRMSLKLHTLKCLSIGTSKTINFPFVPNGKLMVFRCSNIPAHYNEAVIYLNFGTPKNNEFSIWNK